MFRIQLLGLSCPGGLLAPDHHLYLQKVSCFLRDVFPGKSWPLRRPSARTVSSPIGTLRAVTCEEGALPANHRSLATQGVACPGRLSPPHNQSWSLREWVWPLEEGPSPELQSACHVADPPFPTHTSFPILLVPNLDIREAPQPLFYPPSHGHICLLQGQQLWGGELTPHGSHTSGHTALPLPCCAFLQSHIHLQHPKAFAVPLLLDIPTGLTARTLLTPWWILPFFKPGVSAETFLPQGASPAAVPGPQSCLHLPHSTGASCVYLLSSLLDRRLGAQDTLSFLLLFPERSLSQHT